MFPAQLCLFIDPKDILSWIERRRTGNESQTNPRLVIYDGDCGFCKKMIKRAKMADLFATCKYIPFQDIADYKEIHPDLTRERCVYELVLVENRKSLFGGFQAVRRLCFSHPPFYPLIFIFYLPGMGVIGSIFYKIVARLRSRATCQIST